MFQKIIKENTKYKLIVEFRNLQIDSDDNSSYFCVAGNNTTEIFGQEAKFYRGGMLQLKQSAILTSKTQEELNSKTMLLRSFLCAVAGRKVSVECRICLSEDLNLKEYIEYEEQQITFPLAQNQKLMLGDYLATDGIHHVREKEKIDSKYYIATQFEGLCHASRADNIKIFRNKNMEGLCSHFRNAKNNLVVNNVTANEYLKDNEFCFRNASEKDRVYFKNSNLKTLEDWTNFFANNDILIEYDSIEETIEEYTEEQQAVYNKLQKLLLYKHYN